MFYPLPPVLSGLRLPESVNTGSAHLYTKMDNSALPDGGPVRRETGESSYSKT